MRKRAVSELAVRGVETDEELHRANDLMAKVHGQDYYTMLRWLEGPGATSPGFTRAHTRIAVTDGEIVGALRVNPETMRIGEARLRVGGFAAVTTAPDYRHQGVCSRLMEHTLEYLQKGAYHAALLFGIPNFYHRFGFATTLADYATIVETREVLGDTTDFRVRTAKPGDIPHLQRMHAQNDNPVACSLVRTAAHITNKWDRCSEMRVLINAHGRVVAYLLPELKGDQCVVTDLGYEGLDTRACLLQGCAHYAAENALARLRFVIPPNHGFAHLLSRYNSVQETQIARDRGGMMALLNVGESLEHLVPEWERCLMASALVDAHVECTILVHGRAFRLRATRGAMDVAAVSGRNKVSLTAEELTHLITGYRIFDDIFTQKRLILNTNARLLLNTIFPKRHPFCWPFDRF